MKRLFFIGLALILFSAAAVAQDNTGGWRFSRGLGLGADLYQGSVGNIIVDLGVGKDVSQQVYVGGGFQFEGPLADDMSNNFGAFLENRIYFPSASNVSFELRSRLHAIGNVDYEMFLIRLAVLPGAMIKLSPGTDLHLNAGHLMTINTDNGIASHGFAVQTTFDFHRKSGSRNNSRPEQPFHPRGLETGGFAGVSIDQYYRLGEDSDPELLPLFGLYVGYRFNPQLSAGIEVSPGKRYFHADEGEYHQGTGESHFAFALNGRYRLNNKSFSPAGALSAGFTYVDMDKYETKGAFVLTPRVGLSWRLGSGNGYFELYAAPAMGLSFPYQYGLATKKHMYTFLRPEISLHYYHTLGVGSNWFKDIEFK